ncbi:hypothetical protein BGZ57DRAFT_616006 [Hyaloscypha finlandica]|nr:hypothetical protein BGZ57DRAFT_616006 [Hyaloscypha finlandica]
MPFRERPMPGTRRPFSCRAEMHAKGACNHFEPDGTVPFDSIRTVSWWTCRAAPPPRFNAYSEWVWVWVAGRQATRGSQLCYQRENPPSPLLPYFPRRSATCQRVRLHGYTATRDILILSSRVLGRLFPTHRLSCAHPSSAGTGQSVNGWHWLQKRGTQGHSSESPRRPALTQGKGKSTSKLPLPLKLPRSCTVDFLPFMLDDVCSRPTPAYAHVGVSKWKSVLRRSVGM